MCEKINGKATWQSLEEVDPIRDLKDGISTMNNSKSVIAFEDTFRHNTNKYFGKEISAREFAKNV